MTAVASPGGMSPSRTRRRFLARVAAVAVVLLGLVALIGWYIWLPHHRPRLLAGERYGIDVASHQGTIDWARVAGDDIGFAYVKATEGADFVDPAFRRNWDGAAAAGLDRGAYHFFTLCRPGAAQAANFLRAVPADPAALPPAVDVELAGNCAARPDRTTVAAELRSFLEAVESAVAQPVVLYVGDDFEGRYHLRDELDRPVWHRRVLLRPDVDGWWIWQVHGYARVDGIDGRVDLDVMRAPQHGGTDG